MAKTITNIITWLSDWFYKKEDVNTGVIINTQKYNNIKDGESSNLTLTSQESINAAINTKLGELSSIAGTEIIKVVEDKGTAGADTMNKLFITAESGKINVYYTKATTTNGNTTYEWKKMDTDILDEFSWSDIQNNPFNGYSPSSFATSSHGHGGLNGDGTLSTSEATTTNVGGIVYVNTSNTLKKTPHIYAKHIKNPTAFSQIGSTAGASQSEINGLIDAQLGLKAPGGHSHGNLQSTGQVGSTAQPNMNVVTNSEGKITTESKLTSISLVPKGNDSSSPAWNGVITLYFGDEPS